MKVENRIKKNLEFNKVIENGILNRTESLTLYFMKNNYNRLRIGISVPRKSGNAVVRNKITRQIRAIIAQNADYKLSFDLIIVVRKQYDVNSFVKTKDELIYLLGKVG